jgi:hypothetical protein
VTAMRQSSSELKRATAMRAMAGRVVSGSLGMSKDGSMHGRLVVVWTPGSWSALLAYSLDPLT